MNRGPPLGSGSMGRTLRQRLRLYERTTGWLPPAVAARIDMVRYPYRAAWTPLNGQRQRQAMIRELLCLMECNAVVETGTYLGTTTQFFWHNAGVPIYSVEAQPRWFHFAHLRLRGAPGVRLVLGDSRDFLRTLAEDPSVPSERVLFYLDAHWEQDLPLREELEIVAERWREQVVVVDDFAVPDDPGYGFDDYGPGKRLSPQYLDHINGLQRFRRLYPVALSEEETGSRMGCVVLVPDSLEELVPRLQRLREIATSCERAGVAPEGAPGPKGGSVT